MIYGFYLLCFIGASQAEELRLFSATHTKILEKYEGFINAAVLQMQVPQETSFASFKFRAYEISHSIFSCDARKATLYMKLGSIPVINPDGSPFPKSFKNITRQHLYCLEYQTDNKDYYINITEPLPGPYYIAAFLSYSDPKDNAITQQGLGPECFATMDSTLLIKASNSPKTILDDLQFGVTANLNEQKLFKFFMPDYTDHLILQLTDVIFAPKAKELQFNIEPDRIPLKTNLTLKSSEKKGNFMFSVQAGKWHYLSFNFSSEGGVLTDLSSLKFRLKYMSNEIVPSPKNKSKYKVTHKKFISNKLIDLVPYKLYNLVQESSTESFVFGFELEAEVESTFPIPINTTSEQFAALRFKVYEGQIGGTIQVSIAFKPRVTKKNGYKEFEGEPEDHYVIGCVSYLQLESPLGNGKCEGIQAPLILNKTHSNSSMAIPYPESGFWYLTFHLFCGQCEPCQCPDNCQRGFDDCIMQCQADCLKNQCFDCIPTCKKAILNLDECSECDCVGGCKKTKSCNSSIVFDITSFPCIEGECSDHGKCMVLVSDAIVYSTCLCFNNYRGFDCSDGSQAIPYYILMLGLLLLVLSNLFFLPSVYVAYKNKYYAEALCYMSICFFSTFYHACDAGDASINFCITKLAALQFADFFCALLAIWATLVAIADLPRFWPSLTQLIGAIILAFCTTINKTALWIFGVPSISGIVLISISWWFKWRRFGFGFISKKYLIIFMPIGAVLVLIGLLIYSLLQTASNYMYLHSMWHVIMAIAVIFLLPRPSTFRKSEIQTLG